MNCEVNLLTFEKEFQSFGVHHGKAESGGDLLKQHEPIHGSPFSICQTRLSSIFLRYRRQGQNSWKESARYYQNILSFKILLEDKNRAFRTMIHYLFFAEPNIYPFGTSYEEIYKDLVKKDRQLYTGTSLFDLLCTCIFLSSVMISFLFFLFF